MCTNLSSLLLEGPEGWRGDRPWVAERQLPAMERHGRHCQVPGQGSIMAAPQVPCTSTDFTATVVYVSRHRCGVGGAGTDLWRQHGGVRVLQHQLAGRLPAWTQDPQDTLQELETDPKVGLALGASPAGRSTSSAPSPASSAAPAAPSASSSAGPCSASSSWPSGSWGRPWRGTGGHTVPHRQFRENRVHSKNFWGKF